VTAYVSFEHPEGWRCELAQGVWICQSTLEPDRKESVILSIATMATEWDTIENYEAYLKASRKIQDDEGATLMSKVTYVRKRNINGAWWIDSLQHNSELPGFWSRYLATVQNKLAILITYIVSDERYQQLAPQFERMVSSLKPNAEFDLNIASKQADGPLPGREKLGGVTKDILKNRLKPPKRAADVEKEEQPTGSPLVTVFVIVVVGGAVFFFLKKRRKKKLAEKQNQIIKKAG